MNLKTYISEDPVGVIFRVVLENQAWIFPEIFFPSQNMHEYRNILPHRCYNLETGQSDAWRHLQFTHFMCRNGCQQG